MGAFTEPGKKALEQTGRVPGGFQGTWPWQMASGWVGCLPQMEKVQESPEPAFPTSWFSCAPQTGSPGNPLQAEGNGWASVPTHVPWHCSFPGTGAALGHSRHTFLAWPGQQRSSAQRSPGDQELGTDPPAAPILQLSGPPCQPRLQQPGIITSRLAFLWICSPRAE